MLRREEAAERLQSFKIPDWFTRRVAAVAKLPTRAATLGRALLHVKSDGEPANWHERNEIEAEATRVLDKVTARERQALFEALFPRIARYLEAGWQLHTKLPYQLGGSRRGYRAPNDPAVHNSARFTWLKYVADTLNGYDPDIEWCASWTPHLYGWYCSECMGILLAAAIEAGGDEGEKVFEILKESATNQHEIGSMGRHVTRALLVCSRPDAWEFTEKLLLAAQRQEGLRQVILETIDEAHPEAFRRMLRLILDHNLLRFAATVRAVDVWFGLQWSALTPAVLRKTVEQVALMLEDDAARTEALKKASGEPFFFALWATAKNDARDAVAPAKAASTDKDLERRFVAVHFLTDLRHPACEEALKAFIDDSDLRISTRALQAVGDARELFELLEKRIPSLPEKATQLEAVVWPWAVTYASRTYLADRLLKCLGKRPPAVLIPHIEQMSGWTKREVIKKLSEQKRWDDATRDTLFALVGDRDAWVRQAALDALKECTVGESEALKLEGYLSRKTSDLRRAVLTLLGRQKKPALFASAGRLLAFRKTETRLGGLELLRQTCEAGIDVAACQQRVAAYVEKYPTLTPAETAAVEAVRDAGKPVPSLDDALGLMDPSKHTRPIAPKARKAVFLTKATIACLESLDELVHQHHATPITVATYEGPREVLLGSTYSLAAFDQSKPREEEAKKLPLREVWEKWLAGRGKNLVDRDGMELVRALLWSGMYASSWNDEVEKWPSEWRALREHMRNGQKLPQLRYNYVVNSLLPWLVWLHTPENTAGFLLDTLETVFAMVPPEVVSLVIPRNASWNDRQKDWRFHYATLPQLWLGRFDTVAAVTADVWTAKDRVRHWQLMHWRDQPAPGVARFRPSRDVLLAGLENKGANETDLYDQVLGPDQDFDDLMQLTAYPPHEHVSKFPELAHVVAQSRERVLEVELARGENPTGASAPARQLQSVFGLARLMQFHAALTGRPYQYANGLGRAEVFTHLISVTYPNPEDTPEAFASSVKAAKIERKQLLQLTFLAPQWLPHVAQAIGWPGLREAVWWVLAHVSAGNMGARGCDDAMASDFDTNKRWEQMLRERTSLTNEEREERLFDVTWFQRIYEPLGRKRWEELTAAAKVRWSGSGLKKPLYAADVVLGRVKKAELVTKIREKFSREAVRLLGLLPLARGEKRDADLQSRYKVFMAYRRYARSLSPMGREGAIRDLTIGLSNLARTAGYPDPIRLEWAMEAREIADLAAGPLVVQRDGVTVTLELTEQNQPKLTARRGEKELKSIPAPIRKHPKVAVLTERQAELRRSHSRIKQSLEGMMVRGDTFTGRELRQLSAHPLLKMGLERLVLIGEGIKGYPVADGQALEDHDGKVEPVKPDETLRIAHCHDLFESGDWDRWQADCFRKERVQPFKQVFRELYLVTKQEREDGKVSHRYSEQQINPRQSMALWGGRLWNTRDGVTKIFHEAGIIAEVTFRYGGATPLQVEGLTFGDVSFRRRSEWSLMPLEEVPPRIFSEVMRDCDLVVSVAHVGGVDPEASASTVEMRTALVRETCALMNITNFTLQSRHILIDGRLGNYSIHLGSGVVHKLPGGSVCIVPVHAQHRGRLFLPFADDDPRTAEIISKVLLLARDQEIQDPTILEQLR